MDTPVRLPALQQVGVNQHSPAEAKIALLNNAKKQGMLVGQNQRRRTTCSDVDASMSAPFGWNKNQKDSEKGYEDRKPHAREWGVERFI